uniref:Uncharacterized protein n=1 Tax=Glossina pallidipes TaxID=7398 RepID=A0A1B0A8Z9_GLOPL
MAAASAGHQQHQPQPQQQQKLNTANNPNLNTTEIKIPAAKGNKANLAPGWRRLTNNNEIVYVSRPVAAAMAAAAALGKSVEKHKLGELIWLWLPSSSIKNSIRQAMQHQDCDNTNRLTMCTKWQPFY